MKLMITKSKTATKPPSSNIAMTTTSVESVSSLNRRIPLSFASHGHEAFCSSPRTSLKKFLVLVIMRCRKNRAGNAPAKRDSTPNAQCRIGGEGSRQSFEIWCWAFSVRRFLRFKNQVRRDSNPQPTVLETATLPIELLTFWDFRFSIADFRSAQGGRATPQFHSAIGLRQSAIPR